MVDIILAILLIILGTLILTYYNRLEKKQKGGSSIKLIGGGIGCIMIGICLILQEIF